MITIGVRQLRDCLSHSVRRVKAGESLAITERGKAISVLCPPTESAMDQRVEAMLREKIADWGGGNPRGSKRPAKIKGPSMAQTVIDGRR
jgi:antitoxin (DNA-binding transcriptional repressor) of toxin-antitoxin stability system